MQTPLEQTWRWFGPSDPIPLAHIRQAGATGIVTALHDVGCGEEWPVAQIQKRKAEIEAAGLRWSVVESVPVHEAIKQNTKNAQKYINSYCQTLRNLAACDVRLVCYNFMAVTDWTRTSLHTVMPDGGHALRFDRTDAAAFDLFCLKRQDAEFDYPPSMLTEAQRRWTSMTADARAVLSRTVLLGLPGTVADLSVDEFQERLSAYNGINSETLRSHHALFLKQVIPVAEQSNVLLAIHPDDPPFSMFGLPRIAADENDLTRIMQSVDSPANGITFCTGSLGALASNDLPGMINRLGDRIHFLHLRSVKREQDGSFFEDEHLSGSVDMIRVMREVIALTNRRAVSIPMRPDHGHLIGQDLDGPDYYSGYSYIGRLKGLCELRGLERGLRAGR